MANTTTGTTRPTTLLESVLDVQDTSVECNGAIKIPKSRKTPRPKNLAMAPAPVLGIVVTPPTPAPKLYPIFIDGQLPSKSTGILKKLELLPTRHEVILRPKRKLKKTEKRMPYEKGWVNFNGACANCHYGGNASWCSHYQDRKNAEAHLIAQHEEAPEMPNMLPANYTSGSLANSNFKLAGSADTPLLEHVPIPEQATSGVVRGGGGKRIAPTPVPQHGFGQAAISRKGACYVFDS